jgi:hypothetical protein
MAVSLSANVRNRRRAAATRSFRNGSSPPRTAVHPRLREGLIRGISGRRRHPSTLQAVPRIITKNRRDPLTLPGAVIHRPAPDDWHPRMPERLDDEELADWRTGRDAGSIRLGAPADRRGARGRRRMKRSSAPYRLCRRFVHTEHRMINCGLGSSRAPSDRIIVRPSRERVRSPRRRPHRPRRPGGSSTRNPPRFGCAHGATAGSGAWSGGRGRRMPQLPLCGPVPATGSLAPAASARVARRRARGSKEMARRVAVSA